MLPANVKLSSVDYRIRDLVVEINRLPFLDTISSCSGHLSKKFRPSRVTYVGNDLYLRHGWLTFQVDDRYRIVPKFIERIERKVKSYPFAAFEQHARGLLGELKDAGYKLLAGNPYSDVLLREAEEFLGKEVERFLKDFGRYSSHYFSITVDSKNLPDEDLMQARARRRQFYELWERLTIVCREFNQREDVTLLP